MTKIGKEIALGQYIEVEGMKFRVVLHAKRKVCFTHKGMVRIGARAEYVVVG